MYNNIILTIFTKTKKMIKKIEFKDTDGAYRFMIAEALIRNINTTKLAGKIGIPPQSITNALSRKNVKVSSLKQMAKVLGIEVKISLTLKTKKNDNSSEVNTDDRQELQ